MESEREKLTFGLMRAQAEQFRELQQGLSELIVFSKLDSRSKLKASGMQCSAFYRRLRDQNFTVKQLLKFYKAIIEYDNQNRVIEKRWRHRLT